jgi:hypothetical protein
VCPRHGVCSLKSVARYLLADFCSPFTARILSRREGQESAIHTLPWRLTLSVQKQTPWKQAPPPRCPAGPAGLPSPLVPS